MLVAVLSDIHGNLASLETAIRTAESRGAETFVCLGDVVGYGPDPEPCVDIVRERCDAVVMGNHDAAVARDEGMQALPPDGQAAARQHQEWLTQEQKDWLAALPLVTEAHGATLAHAAPLSPEQWPRLDSFHVVQAQFEAFDTDLCFVGHSHKPALVADALGVFSIRPGHRYLIDVGSVGQPRDHDPRLSFALYDTEAGSVETVRAHYDVAATEARIRQRGLPTALAVRLRRGV